MVHLKGFALKYIYLKCIVTNHMGSKEMPSNISMVSGMCWWYNLHEMDHKFEYWDWQLGFWIGGQHIWARYKDHATSKVSFVTWVIHAEVVAKVKLQCASTTKNLIFELVIVSLFMNWWMHLRWFIPNIGWALSLKLFFSYTRMWSKDVYCVPKKCGLKEV